MDYAYLFVAFTGAIMQSKFLKKSCNFFKKIYNISTSIQPALAVAFCWLFAVQETEAYC